MQRISKFVKQRHDNETLKRRREVNNKNISTLIIYIINVKITYSLSIILLIGVKIYIYMGYKVID